MLKDKNIDGVVVARESQKSRSIALIISFLYIPALLFLFHYIYNTFIKTESLTKFKYTTLIMTLSVLLSLVLLVLITYINKKFYIRDKTEFKYAFFFSYLVYMCLQLIYLRAVKIAISEIEFYLLIYIIVNGLTFLLLLFDYNVNSLGVYTEELKDFIMYSTERKFIFKNEISAEELIESKDPLTKLQKIVEAQSKELKYKDDKNNSGKYFTYYIQKHETEKKVYVLIYFSYTGKKFDEILSVNQSYSKEKYEEKLETLNNTINEYLN